jgi:hypothetical protein
MGGEETGGGLSLLKTIGALTAFITALAGLIGVLHQTGMLGAKSAQSSSPPADHSPVPTPSVVEETRRPVIPAPRESSPVSEASTAPSRVSERTVERTGTVDGLGGPVEPPPRRRPAIPNIAGTWLEPGGGAVIIDQHGRDITMRIPMVEQTGIAMGIAPALTMLTGTIQQDDESIGVTAANNLMPMRAQYRLSADGQRLDGTVTNQYTSLNSTLIRR